MGSAPGDLPGDLHRCCLFALIVNGLYCCFRQVCRCHFGLLFCVAICCVFLPALSCNVFLCAGLDVFYLRLVLSICVLQISVRICHVSFAISYLMVNIEFRNEACTHGRYYSCTVYISCVSYLYMCTAHIYVATWFCSGSS